MSIQNVMASADIAARRRSGVAAALVILLVLLVLISLGIGPVRLSPLAVIDALFGGGSDVQQVIVREIRLPRTILGFAIGAILGLSGAALQGLLRNPLASPSLFGAPQSAAFGAVRCRPSLSHSEGSSIVLERLPSAESEVMRQKGRTRPVGITSTLGRD